MNEQRQAAINDAVQTIMMALLVEFLEKPEAVNFNSFTIADGEGLRAIVTVQRPGMKSPIERFHEACEALRAIREIAIDDRGDPRADRIIAIADDALTSKPPAAAPPPVPAS